jgi:hypothetical protein
MAAIMFGIVFKRVHAFWRFFMVVESAFGEYLEGAKAGLAGFGKQAVRRGKNLEMD